MTMQGAPNTNTPATPPAGTPPPAEPPKEAAKTAEPPKEAPKTDKAEAKEPKEAPKTEAKARREVELGDDDEVPDDADLLKLSKKALDKRLNRFSKSQLREHFGTDSVDDIKAKLTRLGELEEKAEEERKAKLSEMEKAKEDAAKEKKRADELERKLQEREEMHQFQGFTDASTSIFSEVFDLDYVDVELGRMGADIQKLSDKEATKLEDPRAFRKWVANWAKERVEAKPKIAKGYEPPAKNDDKKAENADRKKILMTTGNGAGGPEGSKLAGKTPRPGLPNSMNKQELDQYLKEQGYKK